jgi:hypothetical protein
MDEAIRNAAIFGAIALVCATCGWWPRWGWLGGALLSLGAVVTAAVLGVLDLTAPALWVAAWPLEPLLLVAGWVLLGVGLRRLGGVGGLGPVLLGAFLGGAAFGALPVALGLAPERSPRSLARIGLAAVAGGLCGPLGSAPMLLLGDAASRALLWPLGLALGIIAMLPWGAEDDAGPVASGPRVLLLAAPPLWLLAWLGSPLWALLAGLVLVWGLVLARPATPTGTLPGWRPVAHLVSVVVCVLLLVPAGLLDFLVQGVDEVHTLLGGLLDAGFGLAGLGLAGLVGGVPLALAGALTVSSDPASLDAGMRAGLVAGAALGTLLPGLGLAHPRMLRAAPGLWALALVALLAWLAVALV